MQGKITPGLWRAFLMKSRFMAPRWHVGSEDLQVLIARVCDVKDSPEIAAANASAIAAVPWLIEALKSVKSVYSELLTEESPPELQVLVLKSLADINSALRMATGEK